ncbi:adenosylcobalamin-dependent ribonucleoside-diphosphate reductase [Candidatus Woesebacteria bacterium]|nr:adenosylcobalamin-dependent ribonucleoside-diphosphate reductase [Candidatus Woesebacteria bacterium]
MNKYRNGKTETYKNSKIKTKDSSQKDRPVVNANLLAKRYFQGNEKSWGDVVRRVARHAGKKSGRVREFYDAIYSGKFFPSRMSYMGTDNPFASSCFVFPVEDSLHGIMKTLSDACKVQKFGGGTGYNFSHLRPKGDLINTSKGEASGPVSFMGLYHNAMEVVHRAGKKHAAQMGILNCDHPNIMEFIQCKDKEGAYWTFNISVAVTDKFMKAVKNDEDWNLQFGGKAYKTIRAKELWDYIVQHAWHNGDPGVIFIDTVNRNNKYPEPIEACNPCGEQMLPPYVSCNLGSLDLSRFVSGGEVDWGSLEEATRTGIRFLDGSVEAAFWPVKRIRERTHKFKNIGLGVMGWADMLILLGIAYDSEEALELGGKVMKFINDTSESESIKLGLGKRKNTTLTSIAPTGSISILAGCSSGIEPLFGVTTMKNTYVGSYTSVHWVFEKIAKERGFYSEELIKKIAEAGSIQDIDSVPGDVKKLFKTAMEVGWEWHVRHQAAFQKYTDNAVSKTINLSNNATVEDVNRAYIKAYETGCKSITVYRDGSRQVQVMDNKQTKRDMCPNCKAILFMKDGEKTCVTCGYKKPTQDEALADDGKIERVPGELNGEEQKVALVPHKVWIRPMKVAGATYRMKTPVGTAFITINEDESSNPFEVFINIGKAGSDIDAMAEAMGRVISKALKFNGNLTSREKALVLVDQLRGIGGRTSVGFGPNKVRSLPDAIGIALSMHCGFQTNGNGNGLVEKPLGAELSSAKAVVEAKDAGPTGIPLSGRSQDHTVAFSEPIAAPTELSSVPTAPNLELFPKQRAQADICPSCGKASLVYEEGCAKCYACGHSEC